MLQNNLKNHIIKYTNSVISIFYNMDISLFVSKNFQKLSFLKKKKLIKRISKIDLHSIMKINSWACDNDLSQKELKKLYKQLLKFHKLLKDININIKDFDELFNFINNYQLEIINDEASTSVESFEFNSINSNIKNCIWIE